VATDLNPRRGRPPGAFPGHGNPYPEVEAGKYDVSILAALDEHTWAERIGVPRILTEDELLIEIARTAAKVQELRAPMILARVRLIELALYACMKVGLSPIKVAKAAGMRRQALDRWLSSYRSGR